jgi:hypothetical protein
MKQHPLITTTGLVLTLTLLGSPAAAQRKIIGQEETAPEEKPAEEKPGSGDGQNSPKKQGKGKTAPADEAKAKADAEAKAKADAETKAKADAEAAAAEKQRAKEASDAAAKKAAEEAEEQRRLAEEAKKRAAEEREKERLEANKAARLKAAKKTRVYTRSDGKILVSVALTPGHVTHDAVMEMRLEVSEQLDVADPKYGDRKPLSSLDVTATVTEPVQRKGAPKRYRYVVHPLRAPGSYGLHHTPRLAGEHAVKVEGTSRSGRSFTISVPVHVDAWPPPDFDEEEAKNASARTGRASGSRRILSN